MYLIETEEQFVLNRLANATIDSYAMAVVLSRASRSLYFNHSSGQHELNIAKIFCSEVSRTTPSLIVIVTLIIRRVDLFNASSVSRDSSRYY